MSSTTADSAGKLALDGRFALITGASRGIGAECARLLHAAGARLLLVGRDPKAFEALTRTIGARDGDVAIEILDLADAAAVARVSPEITRHTGRVPDIIINNAGYFTIAPAEETSLQDFERAMQVNVTSAFAMVRAMLPAMKAARNGHIVTIGSIADRNAFPGNVAYAASKYAVRAMHEVLREELRGSGVRTTLISPGPTNTDLWNSVNPDAREGFTRRADMLLPSAVADAVLYALTCPPTVNVDELRISRS
jgi:NADP-dependent 3-hydroxy acid dehydrogenase YdfG